MTGAGGTQLLTLAALVPVSGSEGQARSRGRFPGKRTANFPCTSHPLQHGALFAPLCVPLPFSPPALFSLSRLKGRTYCLFYQLSQYLILNKRWLSIYFSIIHTRTKTTTFQIT